MRKGDHTSIIRALPRRPAAFMRCESTRTPQPRVQGQYTLLASVVFFMIHGLEDLPPLHALEELYPDVPREHRQHHRMQHRAMLPMLLDSVLLVALP